jgi:hypothetical protein
MEFCSAGGGKTRKKGVTHIDLCVEGAFFLVQFIIIVGVHFDVVEGEFGFNLQCESGDEM